MNSYKVLCEAFDGKTVLKEDADVGGAAVGGAAGAAVIGINEWLMHWIKELKSVTLDSNSPQEVKDWYDKNIVEDDAIFWTRKANLKMDYFSRAIGMYAQNNDPDYKRKIVSRCNKFIYLTRTCGSAITALWMLKGAITGSPF